LLPEQPEHLGTWVATVSQESPRWETSQGNRLENSQLARLRSTKCIFLSNLLLPLHGWSVAIPALFMGKVVTEEVLSLLPETIWKGNEHRLPSEKWKAKKIVISALLPLEFHRMF